jgi:hypothetical protein
MALVEVVMGSGRAPVTQPALAAPTTSEVIANASWGTILEFEVGGTATTVTIVRPGNTAEGDAVADFVVLTAGTSTRRAVRIPENYKDPATGNVTVQFSQVTAVLARVWRT